MLNQTSKGLELFTFAPTGHWVQFYDEETDLLAPLLEYIGAGLDRGDSCVVIATEGHLKELDSRLQQQGIDTAEAKQSGQYLTLQARDALSKFMVDGMPDKALFKKTIGKIVANAGKNGQKIRAYGEMVALLWADGNQAGTIALEKLWNELAQKYDFCLYCAYPSRLFKGSNAEALAEIHKQHSLITN